MIAEFRTYGCAATDLARLVERLRAAAVPVLRDAGAEVVGPWTRVSDKGGELFYIVHWRDATHMENGWLEFVRDPRWIQARQHPIPITVSRDIWSP
ncbi:hypothetical protein GCM10010399_12990 [Dactylosporangium fulvum]|uniref:NIPSNAP family protein n=1 Tax=Dactylosporangium fulvum TaxID=53359 RepID=A0ABY5W7S7_9ACTN|nr:NIPSNAP family protein [Dactylosporangium fulvum]UWP85279.1 NIPSNAP family protein [Dactylosporangium fulvum]